ncbi:OprO/OprP family phosphate-selective porin [Flavihumibacter solisilvae]|uniref:OprO/OprP family phosphate-selective porin n=1 Tax=Flavihumibacter solisilvae TaxID=1349421 RepID=UPI001269EA62|nr:porin [Flavihumibacter solisilvae]
MKTLWHAAFLHILLCQQLPAQEVKDTVPDGTQGEILTKKNTTDFGKTDKPWNQINFGFTTFRFGVGALFEYAAFGMDKTANEQSDSIGYDPETGYKLRDFRVLLSGQVKSKRFITWKVGLMYDGPTHSWFLRESGVMVGVPELWGHIFVGRTKEGFSLNKVMNGYAGWTMERQMAIDVIPILADGIKWMGYLPKKKFLWNLGIFTDWLSKGQSFSTYDWQTAARLAWLPINDESGKRVLHIGTSLRYGKTLDGKIRLRSRPEAFPAPYIIDTQTFESDHSTHIGGEVYYTKGPLMLGSELYAHKFHAPKSGDPVFQGGDIVASYIITGQSRPYTTVSGIYSFVPVPNSILKGGIGTIEVLLRYSQLDLTDGTITGGKFWRLTPAVNWYLTPSLRLGFAYGYGKLDRVNMKGVHQFAQARLQFVIL